MRLAHHVSMSDSQRPGSQTGGGIPCRPNPAATLLIWLSVTISYVVAVQWFCYILIYIYIHINVILCTVVTDNLNIVGYLISRCLDRVLYCLSIYGFFLYCKHMRLTYARWLTYLLTYYLLTYWLTLVTHYANIAVIVYVVSNKCEQLLLFLMSVVVF